MADHRCDAIQDHRQGHDHVLVHAAVHRCVVNVHAVVNATERLAAAAHATMVAASHHDPTTSAINGVTQAHADLAMHANSCMMQNTHAEVVIATMALIATVQIVTVQIAMAQTATAQIVMALIVMAQSAQARIAMVAQTDIPIAMHQIAMALNVRTAMARTDTTLVDQEVELMVAANVFSRLTSHQAHPTPNAGSLCNKARVDGAMHASLSIRVQLWLPADAQGLVLARVHEVLVAMTTDARDFIEANGV